MKLKLIQDKVLVKLDPFELDFEGSGIIRPGIAKEKPHWGTVLGVGPGNVVKGKYIPTSLNIGDKVYVPWGTGHDLVGSDGRIIVCIREGHILAVKE